MGLIYTGPFWAGRAALALRRRTGTFGMCWSAAEEHVLALGSDFDGCELEPCFAGVESWKHFRITCLRTGCPRSRLTRCFTKMRKNFFKPFYSRKQIC